LITATGYGITGMQLWEWRMVFRLGSVGAGALLLAGCVSTDPPSLSAAQVAALRVERVDVSLAPDALISWAEGEKEFVRSKGLHFPTGVTIDREQEADSPALGEYQERYKALVRTPEAAAFVRNRAAEYLRNGVAEALAGRLTGQQPARVEIVLRRLVVQQRLLRVLVDNDDVLLADATLVESATGRALASFPSLQVTWRNTGGFVGAALAPAIERHPVSRLAKRYGERFRDWLLPS
jgi:hypothetical protein